MAKGGTEAVLYEGINIGEKDFSALVSKMKAAGVDLVYWGGLHTEGGLIVRQMRDQGIKTHDDVGRRHHLRRVRLDRRPGRRRHADDLPAGSAQQPERQSRRGEVPRRYFEPEAYTLYAYAAVQVMAEAAKAAKSLDPKKVAEKMHSGMKFKTVIGDLSYDKKGDITRLDYTMYIWKKDATGKITYVELPPGATN